MITLPVSTTETIITVVLQSLWQFALISLLVELALKILPSALARQRYCIALAGLLGATIWTLCSAGIIASLYEVAVVGVSPLAAQITINTPIQEATGEGTSWQSWAALLWLAGVVLVSAWYLMGYRHTLRMRRVAVTTPDTLLQMYVKLVQSMGLTTAPLLKVSQQVISPMLVGIARPMIILPVSLTNQLPAEQVEYILRHELAHFMRKDHWINALQHCIEILFYFNPGMWRMTYLVRREREYCCDDLAVGDRADRLSYSKALLAVQENTWHAPNAALAFAKDKHPTLQRIQRLMGVQHRTGRHRFDRFAAALIIFGILSWQVMNITKVEAHNGATIDEVLMYSDTDSVNEIVTVHADTLPKEKIDFHTHQNGEEVRCRLDKGEIIYLSINGKVIPKQNYNRYTGMVQELLKNLPKPPPVPPATDGNQVYELIYTDDLGPINNEMEDLRKRLRYKELTVKDRQRLTRQIEELEHIKSKLSHQSRALVVLVEDAHHQMEQVKTEHEAIRIYADQLTREEVQVDDGAHKVFTLNSMGEGSVTIDGTWLRQYLETEGYIQLGDDVKIKFTNNSLKFTGKKLSEDIQQLLETVERNDKKLPDGKFEIIFKEQN